MKKRSIYILLITLFLTACFPQRPIKQVTGEEAIQRIMERFSSVPGTKIIKPSSPLELTIGDLTVRISGFYVWENTIAISVIAHNLSRKKFFPPAPTLTYTTGASLKFNHSTGLLGSSDSFGISLPAEEQVDVIFFDEPHNPKIILPFDGILTLSYLERNLWHEITKLGQPEHVGPFQFQITIPDQ